MKSIINIFSITISSLLLTSCATIFTGTKDMITFNSAPSGATIYRNGIDECKTPCSINVKRKLGSTDMEYKLSGYETRVITLDKKFNGVSFVNLLLAHGLLLGFGIDALTGSMMKYDKKVYDITLSKKQ